MTATEEILYYMRWVHASFPRTLVVWLYGWCELNFEQRPHSFCEHSGEFGSWEAIFLAEIEKRRTLFSFEGLLLNWARISGRDGTDQCGARPVGMPCGHGCAGPVLRVLASIAKEIVDRLERGMPDTERSSK